MGKLQYCATDQTAAHAQKKCVNRYNALRVSGKFFTTHMKGALKQTHPQNDRLGADCKNAGQRLSQLD